MGALFSALIILVVYGLIIGKALKTAKNKNRPTAATTQAAPAAETESEAHREERLRLEAVFAEQPGETGNAEPLRDLTARPSQPARPAWGSMDVETGEGEDTAHGDGFHGSGTMFADEEAGTEKGTPLLSFEGNEVVRGFVMGEILRKRTPSGPVGKG